MVWFWRKKQEEAPVDGDATPADAKRQHKEQQRREKEARKQAERAMKQLQQQAKRARKERVKAEKLVRKQARAVRRAQKQELKAARRTAQKQHKAAKKAAREEKKQRKRERKLHQRQLRQREAVVRAQVETERQRQRQQAQEQEAGDVALPTRDPPQFKEDKRCHSCHAAFQRMLTRRRHHCRNCGESYCSKCLSGVKRPIPWFQLDTPQKVCFTCDVQVFNGMGGASKDKHSAPPPIAAAVPPVAPTSSSSSLSPRLEAPSPLHHSSSVVSESPIENDSPSPSPTAARPVIRLRRPRSRGETSPSPTKAKKSASLWTLPIRPLLKRRASRQRSWDLDVQLKKEEMLARQRRAEMVLVADAPQLAAAS